MTPTSRAGRGHPARLPPAGGRGLAGGAGPDLIGRPRGQLVSPFAFACVATAALTGPNEVLAHPTPAGQVAPFLRVTDYPTLHEAVTRWSELPAPDRGRVLELLAPHLEDATRVGLTNPCDLYIPYRAGTGDLREQGHGHVTGQDLFIRGGRAAWGIEQTLAAFPPLPRSPRGSTPGPGPPGRRRSGGTSRPTGGCRRS